jgi:hypothetical protein
MALSAWPVDEPGKTDDLDRCGHQSTSFDPDGCSSQIFGKGSESPAAHQDLEMPSRCFRAPAESREFIVWRLGSGLDTGLGRQESWLTLGALEPPGQRRAVIQEMKTICHGREPCSRQPHLVSVAALDPACCLWRIETSMQRRGCFLQKLNKPLRQTNGKLAGWLSDRKGAPVTPSITFHVARYILAVAVTVVVEHQNRLTHTDRERERKDSTRR